MVNEPLVSICITSFNYGAYIQDAIESALSQTYRNIEVIVSDNRSTDVTARILASYSDDSRIRVFVNETNVGLCRNHNLAIKRARGEYIVVLSADDVLFPEHVEHLLRRIQDPFDPVLIASGQGMLMTEQLEPIAPLLALGNLPMPYSRRDDFGSLLFMYYHMYPAKLIARSVYEKIGLFDERIIRGIDFDLLARVEAANIPSAFIPELVAGMRRHNNQIGVRSKELDTYTHQEAYSDRLYGYENGLDPGMRWRLEGYEAAILHIANSEYELLAQPVDPKLSARLARLQTVFSSHAQSTPEWPNNEPRLSIIVLSEGYLVLLKATLDAISAQHADRIEVVVVQTSGYDVQPWIRSLPYADRVRVVEVRACANAREAYRFGLQVARGEYVTYLDEGQRIGNDLYSVCLSYVSSTDARVLVFPKSSVNDDFQNMTVPEQRQQQFQHPQGRASERANGGGYSLCQLLHRRGILRAISVLYEKMVSEDEDTFVRLMTSNFQTVMLG